MIEIKQLRFTYPQQNKPALNIDHLRVHEGECLVLCGPSGSGKTSLIRLLNGLIPDYYDGELIGECRIDDKPISQVSIEKLSQKVGTVFQNPASQFFHKIVEHELVFPCENQCLIQELIQKRLSETSQFFGIDHLLQRDLLTTSGGEQQRIAMATAMMQRPSLLILDEPTANLDDLGVRQVTRQLKQLKKLGITVIIAEHRLDFLKDIADRYVYINQGRLEKYWLRDDWLNLTNPQRAALGLRAIGIDLNQKTKSLINCERGLRIKDLLMTNSDKNLGRIEDVIFPSNAVLALVGPNGIGKSTLAQILSGLTKSNGEISLFGQVLSEKERILRTALVMQEVRLQLFSDNVAKEISLGIKDVDEQAYEQICHALKLKPLLDKHPMSLSGGEQQRTLIASSLLTQKQIYIFDEPTSGLDYQQMKEVAKLLQRLKSPDKVIIVITHDKELITEACDEVVDLRQILQ